MKINILPITVLTKLFLTQFLKREHRSGIINISSAAAMITYGGTAHYSATKTFDDYLSRALEYELRHKVDVLTVRPFLVTTPMVHNTTSTAHATPEQTGKEAVNSLGNTDVCYGPLFHRLQAAMINLVSKKVTTKIATDQTVKTKEILNKKK